MDNRHVDIFTGAIMFVVKLCYKNSTEICYANESVVQSVKNIRNTESFINLNWFCLKLEEARKLFVDLIAKDKQTNTWYDPPQQLDYISIVELSTYSPHREYQVIEYREFK